MLGGLLGFAVVYLIFAVIFALFNETGEQFMPRLKALVGDSFVSSWVGQHIYANNFFGRWIIVDIAKGFELHIMQGELGLVDADEFQKEDMQEALWRYCYNLYGEDYKVDLIILKFPNVC